MDGLSLIEAVRELYPSMPVLLLTSEQFQNRPGIYEVLNKPIGREALLQSVRRAIAAGRVEKPKRKIEVFRSSCCDETLITAIRAAACPSCDIVVMDVTAAEVAERASQLGVHSLPAVAIDDELVCSPCECGPNLVKLRAGGLGVPL
jgi:DNA-binding NtrC family response regulator